MCFFEFSLFCFCMFIVNIHGYVDHPDVYLSINQIIPKYGYPMETHEVTTQDGYILTMFRIPHGQGGSGVNPKPILLMHGLFGQSENYIISGINNASLAYFLADNNFDVWLGNTRGNQHGRRHTHLDPRRREFWNFSWHEIGMYDLPAKIDYILDNVKKEKIYYVGHSQGGTSFYIMNSERPEYNKKIVLASLLAPAGYMNHFKNPVILPLARMHRDLTRLVERTVLHELPPRGISLPAFLKLICRGDFLRDFCLGVYHIFLNGGDSGEFSKKMLPLVMKFVPSVSSRQPLHYAQSIMSGHFRKWDYGPQRNLMKYGTIEPPDYNLKNVTAPIAIYYGRGDNLVYTKDVEAICKALPNCVRNFLIPNPKWTHLDFVFATHARKMLHEPLLKFIDKYDKT